MLRRHMESYFGADFSAVRLHVGPEPKLLGARAFTIGSDIFIDPASYEPSTARGRELLGHELSHVLQQRSGRAARAQAGNASGGPAILEDSALEAEAAFMGALAASPEPFPPAFQSPVGAATRRATEGTGIPVGVVQMARFASDGTQLNQLGAQVRRYYDTENVPTFGAWVDYLQVNNARQTLGRLLQGLAQRIPGTRGERIAASRARHALDVLEWDPPGYGGQRSALGRLPRRSWWKLFIEGRHHGKGALYFDLDESPGFYDAMRRAFEQELLPAQQADVDLNFKDYDRLHQMVTNGVLRKTRGNDYEPVPHQRSGQHTTFPMTIPPQKPSDTALLEMTRARELGSEEEVAFNKKYNAKYRVNNTINGQQWVIITNYQTEEVRDRVNALFSRYYEDLRVAAEDRSLAVRSRNLTQDLRKLQVQSQSSGLSNLWGFLGNGGEKEESEEQRVKEESKIQKTYKEGVLGAIVRLVRALHVGHFYTDANGRLNTMLLLNKLLLQNGFTPVILQDNAIFGGRMSKSELVTQVMQGLEAFEQEVRDAERENRPNLVQGEVATTASYLRQGVEGAGRFARDYGAYALVAVVAYYGYNRL
ncbi:DUF4157 domain-containing protein [Sorangium sp. So ce281]